MKGRMNDGRKRKLVWSEDAPWLGGALLGVVAGSILPVVIVRSNAPNPLAVIPAAIGVLFLFGGLYVVMRHVRARWCFRCGRPRERWNHYWFYCPNCREGRWFDDPDSDDAHIDYRRLREPYYLQGANIADTSPAEFSLDSFTGTIDGVTFHVDCLTADTIDVWCDLPEGGMVLPPFTYLRFEGDRSGNKHPARREDIDALIAMGADYIDVGKMGDTVAVGFPREPAFADREFLREAAARIVRIYKLTSKKNAANQDRV